MLLLRSGGSEGGWQLVSNIFLRFSLHTFARERGVREKKLAD